MKKFSVVAILALAVVSVSGAFASSKLSSSKSAVAYYAPEDTVVTEDNGNKDTAEVAKPEVVAEDTVQ